MKEYKLTIQLVPDSCWYSNLRSVLKPAMWDIVRKDAYSRADHKCVICGRKVKRLEAHELWEYDEENCVQKLKDVIAVCHSCHSVIHIGRTALMGKEEDAERWFMKVNKCSYSDYKQALGKANEDHVRRNKISEWKLDVSFLERYIADKKEG